MAENKPKGQLRRSDEFIAFVERYEIGPFEFDQEEDRDRFEQSPAAYVKEFLEAQGYEVNQIFGSPQDFQHMREKACGWHHYVYPPFLRSRWVFIEC